jgi:hypothetical protein
MERFNLNKLNETEGEKQYYVQVPNRFAALEDLDAEVELNSVWETIRKNITISAKYSLGYFELKKHKPWFDEKKQKKLHGLSPRANYTDRVTAASWRSVANLCG